MADEAGKAKSWLSNTFNKVVKHMFSPTMIFMMAAMAFPMVATAASTLGTTATFGDIGMATIDMFGDMIAAPFTDGGVIGDAFNNALDGNFAPGSYEMGTMDHGSMEHDMGGIEHVMEGGVGDVIDKMSPQEMQHAIQMSEGMGVPLSEYISSMQ